MTTIAYSKKRREVATESKMSAGDTTWDLRSRKIFRIRGHVVTPAGDVDSEKLFLEWFRNGCNPAKTPKLEEDFTALVFAPDKKVFMYQRKCVPHDCTHMPIIAEGSGADTAYGALRKGASAREAVRIAIERDNLSGGRVHVCKLWRRRKCKTKR